MDWSNLGVGGIFALLVLKEVIPFITNGRQSRSTMEKMRHKEIREGLGRIYNSQEKGNDLLVDLIKK